MRRGPFKFSNAGLPAVGYRVNAAAAAGVLARANQKISKRTRAEILSGADDALHVLGIALSKLDALAPGLLKITARLRCF